MPIVVIISAVIYTAIVVGWGNTFKYIYVSSNSVQLIEKKLNNPKPVLLCKTEVNSIHEKWRGFVLVIFNNADNFLINGRMRAIILFIRDY